MKNIPLFADEVFADQLTYLLCHDAEHLPTLRPMLTSDNFKPLRGAGPYAQARWPVADLAMRFYDKHQKPVGDLLRSTVMEYAASLQLNERQVDMLDSYLEHLATVMVGVPEAVVDKVALYRAQYIKADVIEDLTTLQASGQLDDEKWTKLFERGMCKLGVSSGTELISFAELLFKEFDDPPYIVDKVLPPGLTLFAGRPKAGKSWMGIELALTVARRTLFLDRWAVTRPGPVLYIAFEDAQRRFHDRMRCLLGALPKDDWRVQDIGQAFMVEGANYGGVAWLREQLRRRPYQLVIIDPLLAVSQTRKPGQDLVRSDYQELQGLRRLSAEFDCAILLIHHTRKEVSGTDLDSILGTSGLTAAVDTLWVMRSWKHSDVISTMSMRGRDVHRPTLKLECPPAPLHDEELSQEYLDGFWRILAEGVQADARGPLQERIMKALHADPNIGLKALATAADTNMNSLKVTLNKMHSLGLVIRQGGGKYKLAEPNAGPCGDPADTHPRDKPN